MRKPSPRQRDTEFPVVKSLGKIATIENGATTNPPKMRELLLHNIDESTYQRMLVIAEERGWPIEELALRAIRYATGLSSEHIAGQDRQDIATMRGVWNQDENLAFREAMEAFRRVDSGPSFEPDEPSDAAEPDR